MTTLANKIKLLPEPKLRELLSSEDWPTPPLKHQAATIVWAGLSDTKRVAFWHDMGTGKTLASIYTHQWWGFNRMLVVCPNSVVEEWQKEATLRTSYQTMLLTGPSAVRKAKLNSPCPIHVINYEGLKVLFARKVKYGSGNKWKADTKLVAAAGYDAVTFDECQGVSNAKALQSKIAKMLSEAANQVIIMSGTPASEGLGDLHSQYLVLDGGKTLGRSRGHFLFDYFDQDFWGSWTIKDEDSELAVLDLVAPVTMRYGKEECLDLPPKTYVERWCGLSGEQQKVNQLLIDGRGIEFPEGKIDYLEPMHVGNKLAQVAGGLLILDNKKVHRFKKNPKLDLLIEGIKEAPGKIVIYHQYIEEGRMIEDRLKSLGIGCAAQRGERKELEVFRSDDQCKVLIAHPKSGGVGLNLQIASTVGFYAHGGLGAAMRAQAEARVHRHGQDKPVLVIDFLARNSIDETRIDKTRDKSEMLRRITAYIEENKKSSN